MELAIVVAASVVAAGAILVGVVRDRAWLPRVTKRRVIVHTTTDQSIDGVLVGSYSDGLVLTAAQFVDQGVPIGGQVWVPRNKVQFVQQVAAPREA